MVSRILPFDRYIPADVLGPQLKTVSDRIYSQFREILPDIEMPVGSDLHHKNANQLLCWINPETSAPYS